MSDAGGAALSSVTSLSGTEYSTAVSGSNNNILSNNESIQVINPTSPAPHPNLSSNFRIEPYGSMVDEKHTNYELVYDMLMGIRTSVSRCQAKPERPLTSRDFRSVQRLDFCASGTEQTPVSKFEFQFKDYSPWVFRCLRDVFDVDTGEYLYILSELYSPGKSGSLFYYSQDFRYIIKTIKQPEYEQLRDILPFYYNHVRRSKNSLLVRYFGLHRLKLSNHRRFYFTVMQNIIPSHVRISEIYDIKGATADRLAPDEGDGISTNGRPRILKDLNWKLRGRKLQLGTEKASLLMGQLREDCRLLSKLHIMDYSFFVAIHSIQPTDPISCNSSDHNGIRSSNSANEDTNEVYFLGIIDILTPYTFWKKVEHYMKTLRYSKQEISTVDPVQYAKRLLTFVRDDMLIAEMDYGLRTLPSIPLAEGTLSKEEEDLPKE